MEIAVRRNRSTQTEELVDRVLYRQSFEGAEAGGTSKAPEDIVSLVSPLLVSLSEALAGATTAFALPGAAIAEPFGSDRVLPPTAGLAGSTCWPSGAFPALPCSAALCLLNGMAATISFTAAALAAAGSC